MISRAPPPSRRSLGAGKSRAEAICRSRPGPAATRGSPGPRPAGRSARGTASSYVVEPDPLNWQIDSGSPPCSPQMPTLRSGAGRAALLDADLASTRRRRRVERLERVDRQDLPLDVVGQEAALTSSRLKPNVICVRSLVPKLKNSASGDLVGRQRRPRHLDHRAELVVDLHAGLLLELFGRPRGALRERGSSFTCPTSGIMISAIGLPPAFLTAICPFRIGRRRPSHPGS